MKEVLEELIALADKEYAKFQSNLTPGMDESSILGVRVPLLKSLAKEMVKDGSYKEFVNELPHRYYDENMLHSAILGNIKDYDEVIDLLDKFLPYVDNWAVCDTIRIKPAKKNLDKLFEKILEWTASKENYTIRFGIEMLMSYYLDDAFKSEYLEIPVSSNNEEYYVKMMVAWYFATALAKQWDESIKYFESPRLDKWTHNKAIQQSIESYRVSEEHKNYLRTLKLR